MTVLTPKNAPKSQRELASVLLDNIHKKKQGDIMKLQSTVLALSSFFALTAFGQDHIKCEFKIPDNKVGCFQTLVGCPEKELKESKKEMLFLVHEGEQFSGRIRLNHVVLHPGTKKQDKNKVFVFEDDLRHEKIRDESNIDLVAYEAEHGIDYFIKKEGPFVYLRLQTQNMKMNYTMRGQVGISDYLLTAQSAISVRCEKVNKQVYEAGERRRKAIEDHIKNRKEKENNIQNASQA